MKIEIAPHWISLLWLQSSLKTPSVQHLGSRNLKCINIGDAVAPNTLAEAWKNLCFCQNYSYFILLDKGNLLQSSGLYTLKRINAHFPNASYETNQSYNILPHLFDILEERLEENKLKVTQIFSTNQQLPLGHKSTYFTIY